MFRGPSWMRPPPSRRLLTTSTSRPPQPSRLLKYTRRTGYFVLGIGTIYCLDRTFNASAIGRNLNTLNTSLMITLDYKLNFTEEKSDLIPELHQRVADRMYNLFTTNGGLYIKIGQAIGANAAFLPKPIQAKFAKLFDDAPQIPYSDVLSVFRSEFGRPPAGPDGIFETFEEQAIASASIAQVHKAKLKPMPGDTEEKWVAVKIQKPAVAKQTEWDLGAYRMVLWAFEHWAFDLPVYFVADFVCNHLRQELDFINEAKNAKRMTALVASEPLFADRVHIPKVYDEFTTRRVMTAEWIDGVRLSDRDGIFKLMGETLTGRGSQQFSVTMPLAESEMHSTSTFAPSKPLKGGVKAVMQMMVELFSAQMFNWGWIHCDPHPGNILIRPNPLKPELPQLVLLDHGLYVNVDHNFRKEWSSLWKYLLTSDYDGVARVGRGWGIGLPDLFASATLMKPARLNKAHTHRHKAEMDEMAQMSQYEQSVRMKAKLKEFLTDTDRTPKQLLFCMRNMRIVQGNNQLLGAPVNRIKITGHWASKSLTRTPNLTLRQRWREYWGYALFRGVMVSLDIAFYLSRAKQWMYKRLGRYAWNFEDEFERTMQSFAKESMGIDMATGAFSG